MNRVGVLDVVTKPSHAGVQRSARRRIVPRLQLLFEIARECLVLAHAGLRRRGHVDHLGRDESRHLESLDRILDAGRTPAEEMLEKFHGPWQGSVDPAYQEYAF